jgi:hypothetical protein
VPGHRRPKDYLYALQDRKPKLRKNLPRRSRTDADAMAEHAGRGSRRVHQVRKPVQAKYYATMQALVKVTQL